MLSAIEICNAALISLGEKPIQSFDDVSDVAIICKTLYPIRRSAILDGYPWTFTFKFNPLSRIATEPKMRWKYSFQMPSDRVSSTPVFVYLSDSVSDNPISDYAVNGSILYSNHKEIWVQYRANIDEKNWPGTFTDLMVDVMEVELAFPITENESLRAGLYAKVYGPPGREGMTGALSTAKFVDSSGTQDTGIRKYPLFESRF